MWRKLNRTSLVAALMIAATLMLAAPAEATHPRPLRGWFVGQGTEFFGRFTQVGFFEGAIDPVAGTAVWTTGNGSTVTNQTTSFELVHEIVPNLFIYHQTLVITGGTGDFEGASGEASAVGLIDLASGWFNGLINGSISRPH